MADKDDVNKQTITVAAMCYVFSNEVVALTLAPSPGHVIMSTNAPITSKRNPFNIVSSFTNDKFVNAD